MKTFKLKDPLFMSDITLLLGGDEHKLRRYLERRFGQDFKMMNKGQEVDFEKQQLSNDGMEFYVEEGEDMLYFVWISSMSIDTLHHEISHLTFDVLSNVGLTLAEASEETYTYWAANLFDQASKKFFAIIRKRL